MQRRASRALLLQLLLVVAARAAEPPGSVPVDLLRPETRRDLEEQLRVRSLDALTLYEIDQAIDESSASLEGRATIAWTNTSAEPVAMLPLLLHPNSAEELGANPAGTGAITISAVEGLDGAKLTWERRRPTLVEVLLAVPLRPGSSVRLKVRYSGRLRALAPAANDPLGQGFEGLSALSGAGASDYGLVGAGDGIVTLASAYPMVAPLRDGKLDASKPTRFGDLAYAAPARYVVRTVVPAGTKVVTNLVDAAPRSAGNGVDVVESRGEVVRDLVVVAGRDLAVQVRAVGGVAVRSHYRPRDAEGGKRALDAAAAALASFEKRFGPYPYRELDVAEATLVGGAGGVEFSGMVLVAGMLYRPPSQSQSQMKVLLDLWSRLGAGELGGAGSAEVDRVADEMVGTILDFTVAHEVAHQYFAGLVGCDTRRFPSLDEPLAQYAAMLAIEDRHGKEAAQEAADRNVKMNYALFRLMKGADAAVVRDVSTFRSGIEYAGLVYGKAPYLYVELRRELGDATLHAAMKAVVREQRFRILTTSEWTEALAKASGKPETVRRLAARYLDGTSGDADLGVAEDGAWALRALLGDEVASSFEEAMAELGMDGAAVFRMMLGGALPGGAPPEVGIDPAAALELLGE